jgi:uncharacterized membrane protein
MAAENRGKVPGMVWGVLVDWAELIVRWTHVVAGIAWIGSSFYFIALDASLRPHPRLDPRVKGEAWQVHGGGFYQMQKFVVAPDFLPAELTWFKWEAYSTWIFGFALLVMVYYLHPGVYLIDPQVADISPYDAVAGGAASLVVGWLAYDLLCKSWVGRDTQRLAVAGFCLLVAAAFAYSCVFSGRGAFIHVGALVGSSMVGNVFFIIIPNQRKIIADLIAGRTPDAALGEQAKQRSLHNNYLTLPVVFVMISNHYAFTYQTRWNWLVLAAVFIASFLVRHWFNTEHTGAKPDWRLWPAAAVPMLAAAALTIWGQPSTPALSGAAAAHPATFADVQDIVSRRCQTCHSAHPSYPGFSEPPKGVMLDTPARIAMLAPQIYTQAVVTRAMPINNATKITDAEREMLADWIRQGSPH